MSKPDFDTVIVGAGFAGASVAHALGGDGVAVIDRGEPFDPAEAYKRFELRHYNVRQGHLSPNIDAEVRALRSTLRSNQLPLPLSRLSANVYSYVQGGISNWWGGYAARLTAETFCQDGVLAWPFDIGTMRPYYEQAEKLLRVHGDPLSEDYTVFGEMPGWKYWREYLGDLFPLARVSPEAKNITDRDASPLGVCLGNGHCATCVNDAKARPGNVFPNVDVFGNSRVDEIVFDGTRATAVRGRSGDEPFEISFNRLVVSAGGLENVALLKRSQLPAGSSRNIGRWYQDHTTCEVLVEMPQPLRHFHLGAEGAIEIPELSGAFCGIELKTVLLPVAPSADQIRALGGETRSAVQLMQSAQHMDRLARFYLQMEVPPEWDLRVRSRGHETFLYTMPYLRHVPLLDAVVLQVIRRMLDAGLRIVSIAPHHREAFGGHHYSGTTPMSRHANAVVDPDLKLIGTDNVYVNGGSVLPRCGGSGPTLTIVALGLRLGAHLRTTSARTPACEVDREPQEVTSAP